MAPDWFEIMSMGMGSSGKWELKWLVCMLIVKIADDDGDMVRSLTYNLEHFCFDDET